MINSVEILKLRILLTFQKEDKRTCTVSGIARTLNEPKQTISRMMIGLEKDGLLDRSNIRMPALTAYGIEKARIYEERIQNALNYLLYEGVNFADAKRDAYLWAIYNTDATMHAVKNMEERYRVKYELRERKQFHGSNLCERMQDGDYHFPFVLYKEQFENGTNISMANEGFLHPCVWSVCDGQGNVQLKAVSTMVKSPRTGKRQMAKLECLEYFHHGEYIAAERHGDYFTIPCEAICFSNIGDGTSRVFHGTVCLKIVDVQGVMHEREQRCILTIFV